jgi:hypothetical protein
VKAKGNSRKRIGVRKRRKEKVRLTGIYLVLCKIKVSVVAAVLRRT